MFVKVSGYTSQYQVDIFVDLCNGTDKISYVYI